MLIYTCVYHMLCPRVTVLLLDDPAAQGDRYFIFYNNL